MLVEIGTIIFGALPIVGVWKKHFDEDDAERKEAEWIGMQNIWLWKMSSGPQRSTPELEKGLERSRKIYTKHRMPCRMIRLYALNSTDQMEHELKNAKYNITTRICADSSARTHFCEALAHACEFVSLNFETSV